MFQKEETAIVLDFLPQGKSAQAQREPVAQVIGELHFTLLEVAPKPGLKLDVGSKIYIGKGERDKVDHIVGRIKYDDLTSAARAEAEKIVGEIVSSREQDYVNFLNRAGSLNIRSHALEHLPSIGKKHLESILKEREKKPFESFADFQQRVPHIGDVRGLFVQRILNELKGIEKYYLFVKLPPREERF